MGIFANDPQGMQGARINTATVPDTKLRHGFDALGHIVSAFRKENANATLKELGIHDSEARYSCIAAMCEYILKDNPHYALETAAKYVDVTGAYRIFAVLLTGYPSNEH